MPVNEPAAEQPAVAVPSPRSEPLAPGAVPVPILPAPLPGAVPLPAPFLVPGGEAPALLAPLVPSVPPPKVLARARSASRWRMRLGIIGGIVALLCVGGVGIAYHEYDKATKPNRSAPDVVVDNYLQAILVDRDAHEAAQYTCLDQSRLASLISFRDSFIASESALGGQTTFSWTHLVVQRFGGSATVDAQLIVDTSGGSSLPGESFHEWRFTTADSSGWHVCAAVPAV
jgi:hypothetical protein